MPRSSRHKSSKHSSRDARDYSDSEDDSSLKERKASEEGNARVPKDAGPSEKRKVDLKDGKELYGSGNGEYLDEYSSSKRRKEKVVDGVSDRWNGGGGEVDERGGDSSKKAKGASESKSKRKDDEIEEMKRSGGKSEKHKETSRKEGRESERRGREARGEKSGDNEEGRSSKREIATESKAESVVQNPDSLSESLPEGRSKRRRDDSADWSKYQDDIGDGKNRHASSVEDAAKDVRRKDEKQRDDRYRERYREEADRDSKNRVEKKKDEYPAKDRTGSKSNDKYSKDDRDNTEARQKKSKPHDGLREHDIDSARDHDHNRDQDRDRERDRDHDQDGYRSRDRIRSGERDRNPARDKERDRDWEHDHDRDREWEVELAHPDDRSNKYNDRRGRRRSPDDHDDYSDSKLRSSKALNSDSEKRSLSGSKVEADGRVGSQSRQAHADITVNSSRRRASPTSSLHGGTDEHRHVRQDDLKYRDLPVESRLKTTERGPKYRSLEKPSKMDDGHYLELSGERSSSSKASPMGLVDRSPSSPSLERRHMHRAGVRRSLDVEEQGRISRASADVRDVSVGEGRFNRDIPSEKQVLDESAQADLSFYNRPGQRSSSIPPPPFRAGVESPTFMGLEEESRNNLNARYKRSGDLSLGRGPVHNWRNVPNWSSPVPNGFMPFQHGPPHGNFQGLMPHFPSPPLFGVRPAMDINQPGIPYPMADTDRFPGHIRPLGWPNMIDASGPSRLHGWDVNSGALRNEPPIYAGPDWDHGRHPVNSRGWETSADMWKGHSGGANVDLPSTSHKESTPAFFPGNESSSVQETQKPNNEESHELVQAKVTEIRASVASSEKETSKPSAEIAGENKSDSSKLSASNKRVNISRFYLSKLDISSELVHSDVYQRCMSLLDGELNSTADEKPVTRVILKNHSRLETKASDGSLSSSLFPAIDDSVFQKAMGLYKKERLESRDIAMSKGALHDFVLSTTLNKVQEQDRVCDEVEEEEPAHTVDERIQSPTSAADQMEVKAISSAAGEEKLGDLVAISGKDVLEPILVSSSKKSGQVHKGQEYLGEDPIGLSLREGEDLIHMSANLDDAQADHILLGDHVPQAAGVLPIDDSGRELVVKAASDHVSEEIGHFGNKLGDYLVVDGPSITHEASMPGSNESQLVNLSRIHHSPESTH